MTEQEAKDQKIQNYIHVGEDRHGVPWVFVPESYGPPAVKSIQLEYQYDVAEKQPEACVTYNNFRYFIPLLFFKIPYMLH